jgi:hypothetical protein
VVKAVDTVRGPDQAEAPAIAEKAAPRPSKSPWRRGLAFLASLRLTVVLFVLGIILVFCGTLAQIDNGIWTVLNQYFRSAVVWVPFQLFVQFAQVFFGVSPSATLSGSFPFPGGWLIGAFLLVNLLAAHLVRFRLAWKRSGILLIHSGVVVLMLGELLTGLFAVEAKMTVAEGESVNFVDVSNSVELALTTSPDGKTDQVVVIPGSVLQKGGVISHDLLPVDVEVVEFMKNTNLVAARDAEAGAAETRLTEEGVPYKLVSKSEESGVDTNQREDAPSVRVNFRKKGTSESLGTHLLSLWYYPNYTQRLLRFPPQEVQADGKTYTAELRLKREYTPYSVQLKEFRHDRYLGTDTPKNFSSLVQLVDPERQEDREVKIYMNHPLRHAGETFYQSGFFRDDHGTILQVVRNPAWLLPYLSCTLVSLGMIVHFGLHLLGFLQRKGIA